MKSILTIWLLCAISFLYAQQDHPYIMILGTLQDGGSPHIGCTKECCKAIDPNKKVSSLALIDPIAQKRFLFDATPDMVSQWRMLNESLHLPYNSMPNGVFLTHAHIGHYTGLMYFGREALGSKNIPVFALPRMKNYLENNGPWSQLTTLNNILLKEIHPGEKTIVTEDLQVEAIKVPHRDEYSETAGFLISSKNKKALFIPDIDKWEKWDHDLIEMIKEVDYAFIDGTFYDTQELNNRKMSEVPHPCVVETIDKLSSLPISEKQKVWFIHLNHTNPLLNKNSAAYQNLIQKGFHVAELRDVFRL